MSKRATKSNFSKEHRHRRRCFAIAVVAFLAACLPLFAWSNSASAAEVRSGNNPSINPNETIRDNVYLIGAEARVQGTVTGNTFVSAGDFLLSGKIDGDLSLAVGSATVGGTVGQSVRVFGGDITITGTVGGDIIVFAGSLAVRPGATVRGDIVLTTRDASILGSVAGTVRGTTDTLTIDGPIGGDVRINTKSARLNAKTRIAGDFIYRSKAKALIDNRAQITGVTEHKQPSFAPWDNMDFWFLGTIFRLLSALIAGAAIVLLVPRSAATIADTLRHTPLQTVIVGIIATILLPIILALSAITLIGLPIAVIGLVFYGSALYLSQIFVGLALGRIVLPHSWGESGRGYNLLAMTLGVIVLAALRLIPIPYIDWVIAALVSIVGIGALVIGLFRYERSVPYHPSM